MRWLSLSLGNKVGWTLWEDSAIEDSGYLTYSNHDWFKQDFPEWLKTKVRGCNVGRVVLEYPVIKGKYVAKDLPFVLEKLGLVQGCCHEWSVECVCFKTKARSKYFDRDGFRHEVALSHGFRHAREYHAASSVHLGAEYLRQAVVS